MGDTAQGQLALIKETVAGATPATPAFLLLDFVDEDLQLNTTQVRSAAVNPSRVVKGNRRAGKEVGNGFRFELYKADEVDMILAALMGNPWNANVSKAGGAVVDTFTLERKLSTNDFRRFQGFRMGQAEFTLAPEQNIMCRVTGSGYTMTTAGAAIAGATYAAAGAGTGNSVDKLNALDVNQITVTGGLTQAFDYETMSFTVNNQLAVRKRLGPQSVRSIGAGQALVTGSMRLFCTDKTIADAFLADTRFDMNAPVAFNAKGYTFGFQDCVLTSYNDNNTGNGDEFMAAVEFEATLDTAYGSSFGITRTASA